MEGKTYYIDAVATEGPASERYGITQTLSLLVLDVDEAARKAALHDEIRSYDGNNVPRQLFDEYNSIRGPMEAYFVLEAGYKFGEILDEIPKFSIKIDEYFNQEDAWNLWNKIKGVNTARRQTLEAALEDISEIDLLDITPEERDRLGFLEYLRDKGKFDD